MISASAEHAWLTCVVRYWCWPVERDFADRTMRVITEKAAPFYAVRGVFMMACYRKGVSMSISSRRMSAKSTSVHDNLS